MRLRLDIVNSLKYAEAILEKVNPSKERGIFLPGDKKPFLNGDSFEVILKDGSPNQMMGLESIQVGLTNRLITGIVFGGNTYFTNSTNMSTYTHLPYRALDILNDCIIHLNMQYCDDTKLLFESINGEYDPLVSDYLRHADNIFDVVNVWVTDEVEVDTEKAVTDKALGVYFKNRRRGIDVNLVDIISEIDKTYTIRSETRDIANMMATILGSISKSITDFRESIWNCDFNQGFVDVYFVDTITGLRGRRYIETNDTNSLNGV